MEYRRRLRAKKLPGAGSKYNFAWPKQQTQLDNRGMSESLADKCAAANRSLFDHRVSADK